MADFSCGLLLKTVELQTSGSSRTRPEGVQCGKTSGSLPRRMRLCVFCIGVCILGFRSIGVAYLDFDPI